MIEEEGKTGGKMVHMVNHLNQMVMSKCCGHDAFGRNLWPWKSK